MPPLEFADEWAVESSAENERESERMVKLEQEVKTEVHLLLPAREQMEHDTVKLEPMS